MTPELFMWIVGFLLLIIGFWLRDWKEKVDTAFSVKQRELDELKGAYHQLTVQMEKRITREELADFKKEFKQDIREVITNAFKVEKGPSS